MKDDATRNTLKEKNKMQMLFFSRTTFSTRFLTKEQREHVGGR
jgi:hypothetical protein